VSSSDRTALVTGASRGVGKGCVESLVAAGMHVYATGRSFADTAAPIEGATCLACDHRDDEQVEAVFRRIGDERGGVDLLVNNAWGGYENMMEGSEFTWPRPFWQQSRGRWDAMFDAGLRAAFVASQLAVPHMIANRRGLIVNISFWPAQKYVGNVPYGVAKAATDKLTHDTAHELRSHDVGVISLYPGLVRTEAVLAASAWLDLSNSESPQFIGRVIAALADDPEVLQYSGSVVVAADYARRHGISDVDGKQPVPLTIANV
jgi:NAD(P)-dependent dehydrogenase (short-subunit alcohol dehydrogenase family)